MSACRACGGQIIGIGSHCSRCSIIREMYLWVELHLRPALKFATGETLQLFASNGAQETLEEMGALIREAARTEIAGRNGNFKRG